MLQCRVTEYCYRPSDGVYFEKKTYNVEVQCYIIDPKVIIINQNKNAHVLHFCDLKPSAQHYLPFVHNYVHMCTLG